MIQEEYEDDDDYGITHGCKPNLISTLLLKSLPVITMMLLQTWDGDQKKLPPFKGWNIFGKEKKKKKKTAQEMHIDICVKMFTSMRNSLAMEVQEQANEFVRHRTKKLMHEKSVVLAKKRLEAAKGKKESMFCCI